MFYETVFCFFFFFFFFQAEDGIRDLTVTGVQTCALPISRTQQQVAPHLGRVNAWAKDESHWVAEGRARAPADRKSTRLNSSHSQISYAVFCLKKKKKRIALLR